MSFIFDFHIVLHRILLDIQITAQTIIVVTQIATVPMHISISICVKPIVIVLIGEELIHELILFP